MRTRFLILAMIMAVASMAQTVKFSSDGGYKDEAFKLTLTPTDAACKVYYTLDGTPPTAAKGKLYTAPIDITTTTPVSAICVSADGTESARVVRTYIFLRDVYRQPSNPKGYPQTWTTGYKADYAMDQTISLGSTYGSMMDEAMKSIPVVCVTTAISSLFEPNKGDKTGGIYIFPEEKGDSSEWERPASVEYYDAKGFVQENCGLRIHGGNSRKPGNTPKHSFRLTFKKAYGNGKLKYDIFEQEGASNKFDRLVLRAGYNYSWLKNGSTKLYPGNIIQRTNAQYVIDSWTKEASHAMGHLFTHRRFVHLFLNGLYWGLYEVSEKVDNKFAVRYLGGEEDDFDVVEDHKGVIDGTRDIFNQMYSTATKAGSDSKSYQKLIDNHLLDLENFVDYMLLQWYIGNDDWDENNWRAIRSTVNPDKGFVFMIWDAEVGFTDVNINKVSLKKGEPTTMVSELKKNKQFVQLVQQRVEKHFLNDGILTPSRAAALYERLCDEIDLAIIGESARWGDYRKSTGETDVTYTRNDFWLKRKQDLLQNYFPKRTEIVLKQLKDAGLFNPDAVDGIVEVENGVSAEANQPLFNASGQRVADTYKGVVLRNGHKYIAR